MPENGDYKDVGYVSKDISNENGIFENNNPKIYLNAEYAFTTNGVEINFRNVAPKEFVITTYLENEVVGQKTYTDPELKFTTKESFGKFNRMEIEFTKTIPNSRITIDNIIIGDITEYTIERTCDIYGNPVGERKNKVKSIAIERNVYKEDNEERELVYEEIEMSGTKMKQTVYFGEPSYDFSVSTENSSVTARIIDESNYMAVVEFTKATEAVLTFEYRITGKQYKVNKFLNTTQHNAHGEEIVWKNPLISASPHASDVQNWLASHFLGDVEYEISWRGDPRIDAGDLT